MNANNNENVFLPLTFVRLSLWAIKNFKACRAGAIFFLRILTEPVLWVRMLLKVIDLCPAIGGLLVEAGHGVKRTLPNKTKKVIYMFFYFHTLIS